VAAVACTFLLLSSLLFSSSIIVHTLTHSSLSPSLFSPATPRDQQSVQQSGLTAYSFEKSDAAVYAFKSAIADTMPGIYPEDITINLILSLGATNPISDSAVFPTLAPTKRPSKNRVTDDDASATDDAYKVESYYYYGGARRELDGEGEGAARDLEAVAKSIKPRDSFPSLGSTSARAADDDTPVATTRSLGMGGDRKLFLGTTPANPTGIAVNYNVTLPIQRLGFTDPDVCYSTLSSQLISAIVGGNFSSFIQAEANNNGVATLLGDASSSSSDFAILNYVRVATGLVTQPPSSYPTATPSMPTSMPSSAPTSPPEGPHLYNEIVAGIVLTCAGIGVYYTTSLILGLLRVNVVAPPQKKMTDASLSAVSNDLDIKLKVFDDSHLAYDRAHGKEYVAV